MCAAALGVTCASHCCWRNCSTVRCPCWASAASLSMGMSSASHTLPDAADGRGLDTIARGRRREGRNEWPRSRKERVKRGAGGQKESTASVGSTRSESAKAARCTTVACLDRATDTCRKQSQKVCVLRLLSLRISSHAPSLRCHCQRDELLSAAAAADTAYGCSAGQPQSHRDDERAWRPVAAVLAGSAPPCPCACTAPPRRRC